MDETIEVLCPVDRCEFSGHFPVGRFADEDQVREECSTSLHLEHPNHPLRDPTRDPLKAFADETVEADLHLDGGQREALRRYIAQRRDKGYSDDIGLADIGAGYIKILFYDRNDGSVVDKELLYPLYGDAVMPPEDPLS